MVVIPISHGCLLIIINNHAKSVNINYMRKNAVHNICIYVYICICVYINKVSYIICIHNICSHTSAFVFAYISKINILCDYNVLIYICCQYYTMCLLERSKQVYSSLLLVYCKHVLLIYNSYTLYKRVLYIYIMSHGITHVI